MSRTTGEPRTSLLSRLFVLCGSMSGPRGNGKFWGCSLFVLSPATGQQHDEDCADRDVGDSARGVERACPALARVCQVDDADAKYVASMGGRRSGRGDEREGSIA